MAQPRKVAAIITTPTRLLAVIGAAAPSQAVPGATLRPDTTCVSAPWEAAGMEQDL